MCAAGGRACGGGRGLSESIRTIPVALSFSRTHYQSHDPLRPLPMPDEPDSVVRRLSMRCEIGAEARETVKEKKPTKTSVVALLSGVLPLLG